MVHWPSAYVEANGLSIHYLRTGGEKPPVVLLHGFYDNGLCWRRVAETLATTYDVILPDTRYHGLTHTPAEATFTYTDLAQDTIALIEGLGLTQPILMGHSMGGNTAAVVAALRPELVRALILEDPAWAPTTAEQDPERDKMELQFLQAFLTNQKTLSHAERLDEAEMAQPLWSTDDLGPWMSAQDQFDMAIFAHLPDGSYLPWRQTPWLDMVARLTCPTLVITSEQKRGSIVGEAVKAEIAQANPRCQVVTVERAGHNIRRERFDDYMQYVNNFLSKL
jgi:N-formylmaleamate deformylase